MVRLWSNTAYSESEERVSGLPELSFEKIADRLGVTKRRVQNLHERPIRKLRKAWLELEGDA